MWAILCAHTLRCFGIHTHDCCPVPSSSMSSHTYTAAVSRLGVEGPWGGHETGHECALLWWHVRCAHGHQSGVWLSCGAHVAIHTGLHRARCSTCTKK